MEFKFKLILLADGIMQVVAIECDEAFVAGDGPGECYFMFVVAFVLRVGKSEAPSDIAFGVRECLAKGFGGGGDLVRCVGAVDSHCPIVVYNGLMKLGIQISVCIVRWEYL